MRLWIIGWLVLALLGLATFPWSPGQAQSGGVGWNAQNSRSQQWSSAAEGLETQDPVAYYARAAKLFQAGRRDEAVFLYYLGQLRFRTYLAANPTLPKSGGPALFGA